MTAAPASPVFAEHPAAVLHALRGLILTDGSAALAVLTSTQGGAVRDPGAMMAIRRDGARTGYLSGGCIDADVARLGVNCVASGRPAVQRYGHGSDIRDIVLPCGGAIDVAVLPVTDLRAVDRLLAETQARRPARFGVADGTLLVGNGPFSVRPALRLRLAGRGADLLALAGLAAHAGHDVLAQTPDGEDARALDAIGVSVGRLTTPTYLTDAGDDADTAFVLLFHDREWEVPLLRQALSGPAFYIGAVGSRRAQAARLAALQGAGVTEGARVRGPIGLVPSTRNASDLAISTLAEILQVRATARPALEAVA